MGGTGSDMSQEVVRIERWFRMLLRSEHGLLYVKGMRHLVCMSIIRQAPVRVKADKIIIGSSEGF